MKKITQLFILFLSAFIVFSCSSKDAGEEFPDADSDVSQDSGNGDGDSLPHETADEDDQADTASENDDPDTSDPVNDSDDPDDPADQDADQTGESTDQDSVPADDPSGPEPDEETSDPTADSDTGTNDDEIGDDDPEIIIPGIPVVFGNICTGQTKCYDETSEIACPGEGDAFFGQDAQYAELGKCIPQRFTVKGTGDEKIVFDENLKLEWRQKITKNVDWQHAAEECAKEYAGGYGWRLPSPKELLSIVDNSKFDPAINTDYFPGTNDEWFWTSADFKSTEAWFIRFDKGFLSHKAKTESAKMHVRCVRGTTLPEGEFETQTIGGDEVVKDSVTGLMWQKTYKEGVNKFAAALSTCENLDYAGFTDWRLPNKNELASIANYARYSPASDFPEMPNNSFRTSTTNAKSSNHAWYIIFSESGITHGGKSNSDFVRCVRR